ncbi:invasion associated locus B family protein [Phyllobacterium sp. 0TCS1.6C]|uniref:invasion associated locus B family protein n=1 Tax=unclassified Phyllobacterium TaxID=2638441 RepID=UPI002263DF50|nr:MULTISPECIES: invasion associated locus B family protein [unclassified Phyllobacterium]MCX8280615.1 invasion associated locus B family protein [Phyllobacterium sp. 0TCS1.6C]MCX8296460.1 invasion associated locus B family protein [Phyllobacterium sp. 0TCS1.6A]
MARFAPILPLAPTLLAPALLAQTLLALALLAQALLALVLFVSPPAGAEEPGTAPHYRLKPSDVALPEGAVPGTYRRIIQPFGNWDLICDEDLKAMKKVCNITQTIIGAADEVVFSWSLAANDKGRPMMIMRVPVGVGAGSEIAVGFPSRREKVMVAVQGCTEAICLAYLPVGPVLREEIGKGGAARISYPLAAENVNLQLPLADLKEALASIK